MKYTSFPSKSKASLHRQRGVFDLVHELERGKIAGVFQMLREIDFKETLYGMPRRQRNLKARQPLERDGLQIFQQARGAFREQLRGAHGRAAIAQYTSMRNVEVSHNRFNIRSLARRAAALTLFKIRREAEQTKQIHLKPPKAEPRLNHSRIHCAQRFEQERINLGLQLHADVRALDQFAARVRKTPSFQIRRELGKVFLDLGLTEQLQLARLFIIINDARNRERFQRRAEAALARARAFGHDFQKSHLAREQRHELAALAHFHGAHDEAFGFDDGHDRGIGVME